MARRWGHAAATASLAGEYTPPRDVHGQDYPAGVPTSAPSGPPRNVSARSRTYTPPLRAQESAPALASLLPGRAARCSSPRSTSAAEEHCAGLPQVRQIPPRPRWLQLPAPLTRDRWQIFHSEDRQTTVASSSSAPQPLSAWPGVAFVRTSQRA